MRWNSGVPSRLHEPTIWRTYHWPRVSSRTCSSLNVSAPSGMWPMNTIVCTHTLRSTFAVKVPASVRFAERPDSSGKTT